MTITASSGQQAATPITYGEKTLVTIAGNQPADVLANAPTGGPSIPVKSQRIAFTINPIGTLAADALVTLCGEINGSSNFPIYYPNTKTVISWTGAEINNSVSGATPGLLATIDGLKVNSIKFVLALGATVASAANGIRTRVLD